MTPSLRVISAASKEWDQWVTRASHDVYHRAGYHRFSERTDGTTARLAVYGTPEQFLAWPYLLQPIDSGSGAGAALYDVTSVYGYAGPLVHGCEPGDSFLGQAWEAISDYWKSTGVITAFCRFHSLLENQRWLSGCASGVLQHGDTVSIDLKLSGEECWERYRRSTRNEINRARRQGLRTMQDVDWRYEAEFLAIYKETMDRNGAAQRYYFTRESLQAFRDCLGESLVLHVTLLDDDLVAASLNSECDGIVQGLYQACRRDAQRMGAQKVHYDDVRRWAQARGNKIFHIGGGRGGYQGDPLFIVKSGFSDRRHPFFTGRWILNPSAYEELTNQFLRSTALQGLEVTDPGYFPAYRAAVREGAVVTAHGGSL